MHEAWLDHQTTVLAYLKDSLVKSSGDGRCESPGFSAKYCTYTVMDQATSLIVDFSFFIHLYYTLHIFFNFTIDLRNFMKQTHSSSVDIIWQAPH